MTTRETADTAVTADTAQRHEAFIALGSNVGDRRAHLDQARLALLAIDAGAEFSSLYETRPMGPSSAPFLNAAACLKTTLTPAALLRALHSMEASAGRLRRERWGARTLDLDLLLMLEGETLLRRAQDGPAPWLPHPGLLERDFVLAPLSELTALPNRVITIDGASVPIWLARISAQARTILSTQPWPAPAQDPAQPS